MPRNYWWWGAWALMGILLVANGGFRALLHYRGEVQRQRRMLSALKAENARLGREWQQIQSDPGYSEYLIRQKLGYIKKDEVEYRFPASRGGRKE